ncbi:hypothetical protein EIN_096430 [Entamoeba invadens IP1]|uniref:Surface antigen BspA-like n=1 Tax=Entamoeba invadens IP1 TaxID=370355 RepID=A0A0A1U6F5_ENTIV|nr:hypothetical protein EIN_096430 [Entamoeba invadens IP1]ELP87386.1 hypothetical protein EIN_096430 [Entamoeba invadens IP1]|eukprot:XP_004254157.1 hypothetical protein EIN_096430 [Entamoeba invadens IP1]
MKFILLLSCLIFSLGENCYQVDQENQCIKDGQTPCSGDVTVLEPTINAICENGFKDNTQITSITIQDNDQFSFRASAFEGATKLQRVASIRNIINVGVKSFKGCTSLTTIDLSSIKVVPESCFEGCTALSEVSSTFGQVVTFENFAFADSGISEINFATDLVKIGEGVFRNTKFTSITLPSKTPSAGFGAHVFEGCKELQTVDVGETFIIPDFTFKGCSKLITFNGFEKINSFGIESFSETPLTAITFNETVTKFGNKAFKSTNLVTIVLPQKIEEFGTNVFDSSNSLTTVTITSNIAIPDGTFVNCTILSTVTGFEMITSFGDFSFSSTKLTTITFGNAVTRLSNKTFVNTNLVSVTFGETEIQKFETGTFKGITSLTTVNFKGQSSIPDFTFQGCNKLLTLTDTNDVNSFGRSAFEGTIFTTFPLGQTIKLMDDNAFKRSQLTQIVLPETPITIFGNGVFESSVNLRMVDLGGNTNIPDFTFKGCTPLNDLRNSAKVISFGASSFENTQISNLEFSPSLKKIGSGAFRNTQMTAVIFPNHQIEEIGEGAFEDVYNLQSVVIGGVTKLPNFIFRNDLLLNSVNGLEKITSFGESCFEGTKITNFIFNNNVERIGTRAFGSTKISNIKLPENPIKELGTNIFEQCWDLAIIDFGGSTRIPQFTFLSCGSLSLLTGTEKVVTVEANAFENTPSLESINLYAPLTSLQDTLLSQKNLFFHGNQQPKALTKIKQGLRIFVTNNYTSTKFGENEVTKLNCSTLQFIDLTAQPPVCKDCEDKKATLDGDNYMCDIDMTQCLATHEKCQICIGDKCTKCEEKLFVDTVKDECVAECPKGYYDGDIICEKCKEHYDKPCKDAECEKCTGGVIGVLVACLAVALFFVF